MPTAEASPVNGTQRRWIWTGLAVVLVGGLGLRLWGVKSGLPYVYGVDEAAHFVPRAIAMSGSELNPHYFDNPPALTYLLHGVFYLWFGGYSGVVHAAALHPAAVYELARVTVAVLGTLALWLLYVLGSRLFDRRVALLATALEAVAFLPAYYSHLALNDVPALVPVTMALIGCAGVVKQGRRRDYALAGLGIGLGAATKYTAGIVLLALVAAVAIRALGDDRARQRRPLAGLMLAGVAALLAFIAANPYALLDFHAFTHELAQESAVAEEAGGKLGAPHESGLVYYLWTLTWGLGWVPALAAVGGGVLAWVRSRSAAWLLTPAIVVFIVIMGTEERFFGRWLMPLIPGLCLLAAFFALTLASAIGRAASAVRPRPGGRVPLPARVASAIAAAAAAAALLFQGLISTVHADAVLARPNTLALTRAWMVAHVPRGARVVPEPVEPQAWLHEAPGLGPPKAVKADSPLSTVSRWRSYPWLLWRIVSSNGSNAGGRWRFVHRYTRVEDYEYTLSPALIDYYAQQHYCWVITASQQYGRALADPHQVPGAIAYYRALARRAVVVYRVSPYSAQSAPVTFNFDWSYDDYPSSYRLSGPEVIVYRLRGGGCDTPRSGL